MEWVAEKVTGGHNGYVSVKSGSVLMDHGKIAKASFNVDMTSITNVDIESEKYREKLIDHIKVKISLKSISTPRPHLK